MSMYLKGWGDCFLQFKVLFRWKHLYGYSRLNTDKSNVLTLCIHSQQPTYPVDPQMATFAHILSSLWGGSPST